MPTGQKERQNKVRKMIKARKLAYEYIRRDEDGNVEGIIRALDGIDLDVKKGDFVAILGHNGSGKSTVAKEINAILKPTEGTLYVNNIDVSDDSLVWEVRQSAGMVFQNPDNQIVASIVEEDVAFGPENLGVPTEEIKRRVDESLEKVEMSAFRKSSPNALSGGQKQRVAIAGILAMKPECIVLDEPTAMLDPRGRKEVIKTLSDLNKNQGITILLITHYMDEVTFADKVIVMDDGKIVMNGTPREIFSRVDEVKSHHLDVPQATELAYELNKRGFNLPSGILTKEEFVNALLG